MPQWKRGGSVRGVTAYPADGWLTGRTLLDGDAGQPRSGHVRALVVVSPLTAPATVAIFRALTGRPPRLVKGADVWLRSG
jgi:hypothetical protein